MRNTPAANVEVLSDLQVQLAEGLVTSEELVSRALAKIKQLQSLNVFITIAGDEALQQAKRCDELRSRGALLGPLHGIPVAVKDNIHVAGLPNTAGTPGLKNFIPSRDAAVVESLKNAGAIILGKTNMHELAYGITSANAAFGDVGNARDSECIAGGSSGGTAVAVATGMAVVGLGTDTGGSSRIPAALNGVFGFRPTTGRYPSAGLTRISHTRDTVGPIARSVADIALLDGLLSGEEESLPSLSLSGIRLAVPRRPFYQNLEAVVASQAEQLLRLLERAGVQLIETDIEQLMALNEKVGFPIVLYETKELLEAYVRENLPGVTLEGLADEIASADVKGIMAGVVKGELDEAVYLEALNHYRPQLQQCYRDYFAAQGVDAMIFPTTPLTARPIVGSLETVELNGEQVATFPTYIRNTDPASNAGIPGLSLPLPVAGMPIGMEIDGPEGKDRKLLAIGAAIEQLLNQQNNNYH